jgi:hypothetical protein
MQQDTLTCVCTIDAKELQRLIPLAVHRCEFFGLTVDQIKEMEVINLIPPLERSNLTPVFIKTCAVCRSNFVSGVVQQFQQSR